MATPTSLILKVLLAGALFIAIICGFVARFTDESDILYYTAEMQSVIMDICNRIPDYESDFGSSSKTCTLEVDIRPCEGLDDSFIAFTVLPFLAVIALIILPLVIGETGTTKTIEKIAYVVLAVVVLIASILILASFVQILQYQKHEDDALEASKKRSSGMDRDKHESDIGNQNQTLTNEHDKDMSSGRGGTGQGDQALKEHDRRYRRVPNVPKNYDRESFNRYMAIPRIVGLIFGLASVVLCLVVVFFLVKGSGGPLPATVAPSKAPSQVIEGEEKPPTAPAPAAKV